MIFMPPYDALLAVKRAAHELDQARRQMAYIDELARQYSAATQGDVIDVEARVVEDVPALPAPGEIAP